MQRIFRALGLFGVVLLVHVGTVVAFIPQAMRFSNEAVLPVVFLISGWVGVTCAGWVTLLSNKGWSPRFPAIYGATAVASVLLAQLGLRADSLPQGQASAAGLALNLAHLLVTAAAVMALRRPGRNLKRDLVISGIAVGLALLSALAIPSIDQWFSTHGTFNPAYRKVIDDGREVARRYLQDAADGHQTRPLALMDGKGSISQESLRGASITCPAVRLLTPPPAAKITVVCDSNLPTGPAPVPTVRLVLEQTDAGWAVLGVD